MAMKITLTKNDLSKVEKLIDTKYLNIEADEFFSDYLLNDYLSVTRKDVEDLVKTQSMTKREAFITSILLAKDISPEDEEFLRMKKEGMLDKVNSQNPMKYKKNPFGLLMKVDERNEGNWHLAYNYYEPFEGFLYDDVYAVDDNYFTEINSIGYFEEKVPYLTLIQNDEIWMSITPFEINTMQKAIDDATGNVITYGLGLGYYAFMALNNPNVEHVTVIEKDPKAIKLFNEEILPKIRLKDKLTIIKADAFIYTKNKFKDEKYDYVFFDIYHSAADGLSSYLKMKKFEDENENTRFVYWIENSMLSLLRRYVITIIEENLQGFTSDDYKVSTNDEEKLINSIYEEMKDMCFESYEEIHSFLRDDNLKEFAKKIRI